MDPWNTVLQTEAVRAEQAQTHPEDHDGCDVCEVSRDSQTVPLIPVVHWVLEVRLDPVSRNMIKSAS